MSVLQCNRINCENIMCDRYSSTYGYICSDCLDELRETLKVLPQFQSYQDQIEEFMNTTKRPSIDTSNIIEDILNQIFILRD